ncbi:MAG: hypothetical protein U1E62_15370 [Alsobacter sp.]
MSLFWNDWVGLAAFGAAFPLPAAPEPPDAEADTGRDGLCFLAWLRDSERERGTDPESGDGRDPHEERLFAAFLSCPWI